MPTLRQQVYEELKEQINRLELAPGTQLIETELSVAMSVSRTPVRQAIRQLVKEGLATTLSPRITVVTSLEEKDVVEIYEVRIALEIFALELGIQHISQEDIAKFLNIYRAETLPGDIVYDLDLKFHNLWIDAASNERLSNVLHHLESEIERYRLFSHQIPTREDQSIQEHIRILEAIQDEDLPKARTHLLIHLENTKNNIIQGIRNS